MSKYKSINLKNYIKTNKISYKANENWEFVNYLDTGSVTQNKIDNVQYIDLKTDKLPSRAKRKVNVGDIIYSTVRPNQLHYGIIKEMPSNFLVSTGFTTITTDKNKLDSSFLYYYLTQKEIVEHLQSIAEQSVSTYPSIKASDIEELEVDFPPLEIQNQIAKILSSIDDKIDLNNRINDNLEKQAQAIFKSWFVDFEPFGGVMPADWVVGTASDFFEISIGKTPPRKEAYWFTTNSSDNVWVSISDMGKSGMFISNSSEYLTSDAVTKFNVQVVPTNTVILSFKLTIGRVAISNGNITTNEAIAHFKNDNNINVEYLYCYLKSFDYQVLGSTSSIATAVNSKTIKSMPYTMPTREILTKFHEITAPLFTTIRNNLIEIEKLTQLRDTLLPRLISGEIDISEVEV